MTVLKNKTKEYSTTGGPNVLFPVKVEEEGS